MAPRHPFIIVLVFLNETFTHTSRSVRSLMFHHTALQNNDITHKRLKGLFDFQRVASTFSMKAWKDGDFQGQRQGLYRIRTHTYKEKSEYVNSRTMTIAFIILCKTFCIFSSDRFLHIAMIFIAFRRINVLMQVV